MTTPPKRPDLSFITQRDLSSQSEFDWWKSLTDSQRESVIRARYERLPELLQLAETLFDMTAHEPKGIVHQMVAKTLKDIADGI